MVNYNHLNIIVYIYIISLYIILYCKYNYIFKILMYYINMFKLYTVY